MGTATIMSEVGEGEYTGRLEYNTTSAEARIAELTSKIATTEADIAALEVELEALEEIVDQMTADLNSAIEAYRANPGNSEYAALEDATEELRVAKLTAEMKKTDIAMREAENESDKDEKAALEILVEDKPEQTLWCAHYSLKLAGSVRTLEIDGLPDLVLIAPHGLSDLVGEMIEPMAQGTNTAIYNNCIHAAWQKYFPTYRICIVTSVDYDTDTCNLDLVPVINSETEQDVNQTATLSTVPIEYKPCNSEVFEVDQRVVVEFLEQDWNDPVVIGFETEPKSCHWERFPHRPGQYWPDNVLNFDLRFIYLKQFWFLRFASRTRYGTSDVTVETIEGNKLKITFGGGNYPVRQAASYPAVGDWTLWSWSVEFLATSAKQWFDNFDPDDAEKWVSYHPEEYPDPHPPLLEDVLVTASNELIIKLKCVTAYRMGEEKTHSSLPQEDTFFQSFAYIRLAIGEDFYTQDHIYYYFKDDIDEPRELRIPFGDMDGWSDELEGSVLDRVRLYMEQGYPDWPLFDFEIDYISFKDMKEVP